MSLYREIRMRLRDTLIPSLMSGMKNLELNEFMLQWDNNRTEDLQFVLYMFPSCELLKTLIESDAIKQPYECRFIIKNDGSLYVRAYNRNEGNWMVNRGHNEVKVMDKQMIIDEQMVSTNALNGITSMFIQACKQLIDESKGLKGIMVEIEQISNNPCRRVLLEKTIIK